ncbi:unnamed protein product [Rotaria sp. Silwood2]|nr:unnamed protein product [Rotaria sp. Silwood2]CAF2770998.1 unnamed protein product [Rotaria sp. Silwood2]
MIVATRESHSRLLHFSEHRPRRRHHTLDNATLDQFNFICVPLNLDEGRINPSWSHSNLTSTSSNDFSNSKPTRLSSPTRRVRFKFDENNKNEGANNDEHARSSDVIRLPKNYSIHRVEFQIPIHTGIIIIILYNIHIVNVCLFFFIQDVNPWLNIDCSSTMPTPAKTRSLTSQKIDINYSNNNNNSINGQEMTTFINSPTVHEQQNPYKPTYTFPEEFDGNFERMEDYMKKAASQNIDDDYRHVPSSPIRTSTTAIKDHKAIPKRNTEKLIRFDDQLSSPTMTASSVERAKSNNDASTSSIMINSRPNTNCIRTPSSITDDEQKLIYKQILRGGDIPSTGLQKFSANNRGRHFDFFFFLM